MLNVVFEFCLYTFNTSVAFSTNTVKQIALRWLFHIFVSLDLSVGFEQIACIATSNRKMQMESECKSEYVQRNLKHFMKIENISSFEFSVSKLLTADPCH